MPIDAISNILNGGMVHDPDARFVHAINGQLLEKLFGRGACLESFLVDRLSWIINVLYVYGPPDGAPMLRTSATFFHGDVYDHTTRFDGRGGVHGIDEPVPLGTSMSGRCILSGRPIWLSRADFGERASEDVRGKYRRFSAANVDTSGYKYPKAEIVFPIAAQHLNAMRAFGVLNLELFGEYPAFPDEYIAGLPREEINEIVSDILHVHSGFLKVAIDLLSLKSEARDKFAMNSDDITTAEDDPDVEHMLALHELTLNLLIKRNRRRIERLEERMKRLAEEVPMLRPTDE